MWQSLLEDYDLFEQLMPFKLNIGNLITLKPHCNRNEIQIRNINIQLNRSGWIWSVCTSIFLVILSPTSIYSIVCYDMWMNIKYEWIFYVYT